MFHNVFVALWPTNLSRGLLTSPLNSCYSSTCYNRSSFYTVTYTFSFIARHLRHLRPSYEEMAKRENLSCFSLNANGLLLAPKRKAIFNSIRKGSFDVAFLQETHCVSNSENIWRAEWGGDMHFSNGSTNARGVAILIKRDLDIKIRHSFKDEDGRLLVLIIEKKEELFLIANVYAPTQDRPEEQIKLMDLLEDTISGFDVQNIIVGGDLNICMDPLLDKTSSSSTQPQYETSPYRSRVLAFCENLCLSDIWRRLNPLGKAFSFRRGQYASRLDYWLASDHMICPDTSSSIVPCSLSDHASITLKLGSKTQKNGPGLWRLDNTLLQNQEYRELISGLLDELEHLDDLSNPNAKWEWLKFTIKSESITFARTLRSERKRHEHQLQDQYESLSKELDEGNVDVEDELNSVEREL